MRLLLKPAPGETVLDEAGNVFPVQGYTVTVNSYYEPLMAAGLLRREEQYSAALTAPPSLGQLVLSGGTGAAGEFPVRQADGTLEFEASAASAAATDGVLVSELSGIAITLLNDGTVRFCSGGLVDGDNQGGMFYAKFGDVTAAVAGENIAATGGRWKRIQNSVKHVLLYDLLIGNRKGAYADEIVQSCGYYYRNNPNTGIQGAGDGARKWLRWDATSTRPADGVRVFGDATTGAGAGYVDPATGIANPTYYPDAVGGAALPNYPVTAGRWIVLNDSKYLHVRQAGCVANGYPATVAPFISDDNGLFNAILACFAYGSILDIDACRLAVTKCIRAIKTGNVSSAAAANLHIKGANAGGQTFNSSLIEWHGNSTTDPIMCLANNDSLVEGVEFKVMPGKHAVAGINIGWHTSDVVGTPSVITHQRIKNCAFVGASATVGGAGSMEWGVVFDHFQIQTANIENSTIDDCSFVNMRNGAIQLRYNCQPYNTVVRRCYYISSLHSVSQRPYGTFIRNESASCSLQMYDCDVQRCGLILDLVQPFQGFSCVGLSSEQSKKLYWGLFGTTQAESVMSFTGGRNDMGALAVASEGPGNATFSAADVRWAAVGATVHVGFRDFAATLSYVSCPFEIGYSSGNVHATNCTFPNLEPFIALNDYNTSHIQGGVWSQGNTAPGTGAHAGTQQSMPLLQGTRCPGGTFTITGAATTQAVVFYMLDGVTAQAEGVGATGYRVRFECIGWTGTPTPGSVGAVMAASKTNAGFTATTPVAPGVGATVTYRYELYRSHLP